MLLVLKQHLKDQYGFRDSTIHRYSPTEAAKVYEKQLNRKPGIEFNPARALELIRNGRPNLPLSEDTKLEIVQEYLDVSSYQFIKYDGIKSVLLMKDYHGR